MNCSLYSGHTLLRHEPQLHSARELQTISERRFTPKNAAYRSRLWAIFVAVFFQPMISSDSAVLDLACGYDEFGSLVFCGRRHALDLNPQSSGFLVSEINFLF